MSDYQVDDTIYHKFTTRAFATGIPTVLAGTPVVSIYEDDSVTQITAGITLTVDFDSVAGLNHLTVVATGANGFEAGKFYQAVITTGTVGSVSVVGETVWSFSLDASAAALDLANGTDGLGAIKADTAATLVDTAEIGTAGAGLTNIGTVATVTTLTGHTPQTGDTYALANGAAGFAAIDTVVDAILVDTGTTIPATITTAQNDLDIITGASGVNLLAATQASIDAIETDTATTIPGQISGLNDVAATDIVSSGAITTLAGAVVNVDLVDTTTTNTDMRGTDSANTVVPDAAGTAPTLSEILTTAMTESYAADGAAPSLAQALFLIQQTIGEFAISGTTITAKKLDGAATAATYTLDDGTSPTSRTRAS